MIEGLDIAGSASQKAAGLVDGLVPPALAASGAMASTKLASPLNGLDVGALAFKLPEINPMDIVGAVLGEIKLEVSLDSLASFLPSLPTIPLPEFPKNPFADVPNPLAFLPADRVADLGNPLDALFGTISPLEAYLKRVIPAIPNPIDGISGDLNKLATLKPTELKLDVTLPEIPSVPAIPELPAIPDVTNIVGDILP